MRYHSIIITTMVCLLVKIVSILSSLFLLMTLQRTFGISKFSIATCLMSKTIQRLYIWNRYLFSVENQCSLVIIDINTCLKTSTRSSILYFFISFLIILIVFFCLAHARNILFMYSVSSPPINRQRII